MDTFSSSLPLTLLAVFSLTSYFLFLGTLSSWPIIFFSWLLLLIVFAGSSPPKSLNIVVSWDQCWIFFLPTIFSIFLFYDFTQQKSTELPYLYLIWALDLPNTSTGISHRHLYVTYPKLQFGLLWSPSLFYVSVNVTPIHLATPAHKVIILFAKGPQDISTRKPKQILLCYEKCFVMRCPLIPRQFPKVAEVCKP